MKRSELGKIIFEEMVSMIKPDEIYDGKMLIEGFIKYRNEFTTDEGIKKLIKDNLGK